MLYEETHMMNALKSVELLKNDNSCVRLIFSLYFMNFVNPTLVYLIIYYVVYTKKIKNFGKKSSWFYKTKRKKRFSTLFKPQVEKNAFTTYITSGSD